MTKYVVIASGKGGVGKTITAINVATALSMVERDALVVDANTTTPHISLHLGMHHAHPTLQDVLEGKATIRDATYLHRSGLKIIPSRLSGSSQEHFSSRLPKVALDLFGKSEFVFIDSAAGLGEETQSALLCADDALIVTNPNLPAVFDARKTVKLAESKDVNVLGVIVNRVTGDKHELSLNDITSIVKKPVLSSIPEDKNVHRSISLNHPLVYSFPTSPASREFKKLAALFLE